MKIGINGFEAVMPRFGYDKNGFPNRVGSSEFCFQLLKQFERTDLKNEYLIFLPDKPSADMPEETDRWRYKIIPNRKMWTIFGLSKELVMNHGLDVFFSPTHYGPIYTPCPQVISILDVSYKHFPEMFPKKDLIKLKFWGRYSINSSHKIVTISESSKNDIINEYKVPASKIEVVHLGIKDISQAKMNRKDLVQKYDLDDPYLLFVGTLQPRKNIARLIEAFSKIEKKGVDLIIVGRKGWDFKKILEAPKKYQVKNRVRFLELVTDKELPALYEGATAFVLPSLYEGFGLPILEAMRYGCPVLTSSISSLPEAGGDAAVYFDPQDPNDIAEKINAVLKSEKLRDEMRKKGYEQVKRFSWKKSAKEVIQIFESLL